MQKPQISVHINIILTNLIFLCFICYITHVTCELHSYREYGNNSSHTSNAQACKCSCVCASTTGGSSVSFCLRFSHWITSWSRSSQCTSCSRPWPAFATWASGSSGSGWVKASCVCCVWTSQVYVPSLFSRSCTKSDRREPAPKLFSSSVWFFSWSSSTPATWSTAWLRSTSCTGVRSTSRRWGHVLCL